MTDDGAHKPGGLRSRLHAPTKHAFDAFVRLAGRSLGEPPWFAPPVDASEDLDSYAVAFHVAGYTRRDLAVTAANNTLIVWGLARDEATRRGRRICTLPAPIDSRSLEVVQDGDLLTVKTARKVLRGESERR